MSKNLNPWEKPFDIFVSYKSENIAWVNALKDSLEARGIKVWMDKEQIRPGDLFAESLEDGIEMSKTMGLVITPESLSSNWVREEYYRALSLVNEDKLHLIPILLQQTSLPGFLKGRQYIDFSDSGHYEQNVDRLIWPGITGKRIVVAWLQSGEKPNPHHHYDDEETTLQRLVNNLGVETIKIGLDREAPWWRRAINFSTIYRPARHIVFVNLFDDDQKPEFRRYSPTQHTDFIFRLREMTKGTQDELVFVLYHNSGALEAASNLSPDAVQRLRHYFIINHDSPEDVIAQKLHRVWREAQRLLLNTEIYVPQQDTVSCDSLSVHAIYADTKHIRTMKIGFGTNCFVRESGMKFSFESSNLIAQFTGKRTAPPQLNSVDSFFKITNSKDSFTFTPTGYNGVWFDFESKIHAEIEYQTRFGAEDRIVAHLEFLRSQE